MVKVTIFSVKNCPKCEQLKSSIPDKCYRVEDMAEPKVLAYLRCNDVFETSAPILQVNDQFYSVRELFKDGNLQLDFLSSVLSVAFREDVEETIEQLEANRNYHSAAIVQMLYLHNQKFQADLKNLKTLNDDLMGHCNSLRNQLR